MQAHYKVLQVYIRGQWRVICWLAKQRKGIIRFVFWKVTLASERSATIGMGLGMETDSGGKRRPGRRHLQGSR